MKTITDLPQLINFLKNEPLVISESSVSSIKTNIFESKNRSIFFGVGVMTETQTSENVPFDILAMFFMSELLRQRLNFRKVIVLIADTHALSNNKFSNTEINRITSKTKKTLDKIISNFNLSSFELICASEIHNKKELKEIMNELPSLPNEYLKHEIADLIWFSKTENAMIKIGWALTKHANNIGHDERFFDKEISKFLSNLSFIHLESGKTFNPKRLRVSPYLSLKGEKRILLLPNENVELKIQEAKNNLSPDFFRGTTNHLAHIVRIFEKLNGNLLNMSFEKKIEFILRKSIE